MASFCKLELYEVPFIETSAKSIFPSVSYSEWKKRGLEVL